MDAVFVVDHVECRVLVQKPAGETDPKLAAATFATVMEEELLSVYVAGRSVLRRNRDGGIEKRLSM